MRPVLSLLFLLVAFTETRAESYKRQRSESIRDFLVRIVGDPNLLLVDSFRLGGYSRAHSKDMLCVYRTDAGQQEADSVLYACLLLPEKDSTYQFVVVDQYGPEGREAQIVTSFTANADKDQARELVVLCQWPQEHAGVSGKLFAARFYDDVHHVKDGKLMKLDELDQAFGMEFAGVQEGQRKYASYTTETAIKKKLKSLKFKRQP